ncbi:MAG: helix-turn-helix domain-containing protein [Deferrisomatales bacterium]
MSDLPGSPEPIAVVSASPCLRLRVREALEPLGLQVEPASDAAEFARHRRQRPFLLCFVDARGAHGAEESRTCLQARPAERYVRILGPWQGATTDGEAEGIGVPFGFLREPFGEEEVRAWARRAAAEARLLRGDCSLEDLLYGRFRSFLSNLGTQTTSPMHAVVLERVERPLLRAVLEWAGGNQTRAAEVLGIHRNTLRAKVRSLGVEPSRQGR